MPAETSARLLRLLSLLQRRPSWNGPDLAERLGVTTRTVRRDVDRLRSLGYPVDAAPGITGGYRLEPGVTMPPLLLDDDEATAVALALRAATSESSNGLGEGVAEASLSALSKLDRVLPPQVRAMIDALRAATVDLRPAPAGDGLGEPSSMGVLVTAAHACAGSERLLMTYRDRNGQSSERRIDPHRVVFTGRRWYLVARDVDRAAEAASSADDESGGWRTFRVDRIEELVATGHRVRIDNPPDAAKLVSSGVSVAPYRYAATVRFAVTPEALRMMIPPTVGVVTGDGDGSILEIGADDLNGIAGHLVALGVPFEVLDPPEFREHMRALADRLLDAHREP